MKHATREEIDAAIAGKTVASQFLDMVASRPEAVALRWKEDGQWAEWTWNQLSEKAASAAGGLSALGVGPGDRVVMMLRNRPEFHVADLAVLFLGATPISIYNSSAPDQVAYLTSHCEAKVAIVEDAGFLDRFVKARSDLPALKHIAVIEEPGDGAPEGVIRYAEILSGPALDLPAAAKKLSPDSLATVIYTSGTTGPPKGVMLSNYTVCWTIESMARIHGAPVTGKRMVSFLPMAHIAERMLSHYQHVVLGTEVTDCPEVPELSSYLREVRPQLFMGVPRVWEKIHAGVQAVIASDPTKQVPFAKALAIGRRCSAAREDGKPLPMELEAAWEQADSEAFRPLREMLGLDEMECAITGAAPIPHEVFDFFRAIGVPFSEIYGLSECCGPMTWERFRVRSRTVGPAIPGSEVKLLDDGEVACRGGNVFLGYLNDPDRTAEVLDKDGWLHSGDIGTLDNDGFLRIVDRKKELIITAGGKNVSPANIEAALKSFPIIGQACAIGDGKPFISALLVLDPEVAVAWAKQKGIAASSLPELASDPDIHAEMEHCVHEANKEFNKAEQVKRFVILGDEWQPDSEELTPTMKLKRRGVHAKYADEIASLYS